MFCRIGAQQKVTLKKIFIEKGNHSIGSSRRHWFVYLVCCKLAIKYSSSGAKLQPHKTIDIHSLLPPDHKARILYCRWFQEFLFIGPLDPEFMFYSGEVCITLSGHTNNHNNMYQTEKILMLL
jgi:hypothetical protein